MPFLPERIKIEKVEKLVTYLHDKTEYVIHIRMIRFNQKASLKPYNDMTTKLRQKAKTKKMFEEDFFKLINNAVFGKTMKNVRKNRNIKFVARERRRNYLVPEANYDTTKFF